MTGKTDEVLIDTQWTLSNAHRVIAEILETGKNLTTIYVTHAHPDHYFGLGPIHERYDILLLITTLIRYAKINSEQVLSIFATSCLN